MICGVALGQFAFALGDVAVAAPRRNHSILQLENAGAQRDGLPADARREVIVVFDDATVARGTVANTRAVEVKVFDQPNDSGFGWFMKDDDVFGYGTWATQQILGNGFVPGDRVSSYDTLFFHSSFDDPALGDATVMTELWNGDPMSIMDTVCTAAGVSAPIPGTQATFTDIPWSEVVRLQAKLRPEVTIDCDRVWTVMTFLQGCRGTWRLAGMDGGSFNAPPTIGAGNGVWLLWSCEQFGACNTANGYNAGTCCNSPETACDHTDGTLECDPNGTAPGAEPSFCGDGAADYFLADVNEPGVVKSLVSSVSATARTIVALVPVSVDAPPTDGGDSGVGAVIDRNRVILPGGDHNVWLEFRIGDWDPKDRDVQLGAWQLAFDSAGFTSGIQGELTVYTGGPVHTNCAGDGDDAPCVAALGPGSTCDPTGFFLSPGTCAFAFIDLDRDDFVYKDAGVPIVLFDLASADVRPAGTVISGPPDDPEPFPDDGLYAGTLTLHVPANAKGTFTVGLKPFPESQLVNQHGGFIPLMGVRPTHIRVLR